MAAQLGLVLNFAIQSDGTSPTRWEHLDECKLRLPFGRLVRSVRFYGHTERIPLEELEVGLLLSARAP